MMLWYECLICPSKAGCPGGLCGAPMAMNRAQALNCTCACVMHAQTHTHTHTHTRARAHTCAHTHTHVCEALCAGSRHRLFCWVLAMQPSRCVTAACAHAPAPLRPPPPQSTTAEGPARPAQCTKAPTLPPPPPVFAMAAQLAIVPAPLLGPAGAFLESIQLQTRLGPHNGRCAQRADAGAPKDVRHDPRAHGPLAPAPLLSSASGAARHARHVWAGARRFKTNNVQYCMADVHSMHTRGRLCPYHGRRRCM